MLFVSTWGWYCTDMTRTFLGLVPLTLAVVSLSFACGDDTPGTTSLSTDTGETVGDGDGDPGDGDGDTGDGDGDTGDGDGDPEPPPDEDMDGVPDGSDNCPADANPNQLDFDGNGTGNTCDVMVFNATGMLNTTAHADAGALGSCAIPIVIDVTGGQIMLQLDDNAAVAGFEIANLNVADILDKECQLLVTATVSMTNFLISNSGGPYPVTITHDQTMHDAGQVAGDADIPHPVLSTATLSAAVGADEPMDSELMLDGALPIFTASITDGGAMGTVAWADAQFVLAQDQFMIEMPLMATIDFELRGLVGALTLSPSP
jgi:hypothetical protein